MTHIVGVVEGYWDFFDKFLRYFHGKTYANGKAKVRARVILPVHFGINECGKEEFLADLKSFTTLKCGNTPGGKNKKLYFFFAKMFRMLFPKLKDVKKQFEKVESTDLKAKEGAKGNHFILNFYPIGELPDGRYEDGREIV